MQIATGQRWTYRAPQGFESSRLIVGAIVTFHGSRSVLCCSIVGAARRRADGTFETVNIPFLPMIEPAFWATVVALDGMAEPPPSFAQKLQDWSDDPRGLTTFTVPFEGFLDRMIAMQMAEIAGQSAA